jgi:predicted porin
MKKTLVGLAAAAAMCSASAASVTLYGIIDTGFAYNSYNDDNYSTLTDNADNSFGMMSGQSSGSRFGLKGVEELGNGLTVGFILENGFNSDTGAMGDDRLFNRESSIYIEGGFGKFGMGRLSTLANDSGTTGLGGYFSSFGTGWGDVGVQSYMQAYRPTRMDNMVYYKTPNFAGAEVWVLYGMGDEEDKTYENESSRDRYYAAAVTYNNGGLSLYGAVDVLNKASFGTANNTADTKDDQITITAAVNYDCGFAKSYLGVHWFDNAKAVGASSYDGDWSRLGNFGETQGYGDANGWSVMLGVDIPVGNGKVKTTLGYLDASSDNEGIGSADADQDLKRFMVGAGYEYYLSKRTTVYMGAGYLQDSIDTAKGNSYDPSWVQVNCGLKHKF